MKRSTGTFARLTPEVVGRSTAEVLTVFSKVRTMYLPVGPVDTNGITQANLSHHQWSDYPNLVKQNREMIQSGELPLGAKLLPERELAHKPNVSPSSLRQAFKALESMGVLSSRVGAFVRTDMDAGSLLTDPMEFVVRTNQISRTKLLEARQFLEVEVVGLTTERASDEAIALIGREL